jgi:hypothetical protein
MPGIRKNFVELDDRRLLQQRTGEILTNSGHDTIAR